ncbi:MAG: acyltransferase [Saccharofermentans sp.]|nr:acyltransferase [Saccharofermentans sp.]
MTSKATRDIHFDILRIIAMLLVILFHYTTQFSNTVQQTSFLFFFSSDYSAFAVAVFLLMVGYFSYKPLNKNQSSFDYLKSRLIRLLPTFWVCLIFTSLVLTITGTNRVSVKQFILNAFLINRFFNVSFVDGAYWYMIIVLVFTVIISTALLIKSFQKRTLIFLVYTFSFVIFGIINRYIYSIPGILSFALFEYLNKCFIGLFLAFLYFEWNTRTAKIKFIVVLLIAALIWGEFLWIGVRKTSIEIFAVVLFSAFIFWGKHIRIKGCVAKFIFIVSTESYFIYLVHQQVGFVFIKSMINHGINCNLSIFIAFLFVAILAGIHYCINKVINLRVLHKSE